MANKLSESMRGRKLRRSRNVSSFLEESIESATPSKTTVSVVVDVHNGGESSGRQQRDDENDLTVELSDDKETKRSSESSKASSRTDEVSRNRSSDRETRNPSKDHFKRSHDDLPVELFDLINKFERPEKKNEFLKEKPRRRKQWSTVANVTNEAEVDSKRPPRKRWSKDTGVIRLPETRDEVFPLTDNSRKAPVPAPRTSVQRNNTLCFDNPTFVSENEDEVLRIETDHNRESTKIEMRRMSDRSNVEDADKIGTTSSGSSRKHRREAVTTSERRLVANNEDRSSRTRSSESRRNSVAEADSSTSLERIADVRSSSIASEERGVSSERKSRSEARRERSSRRKEQSFKKEPPGDDEFVSSSARDANSLVEADARVKRKRRKKRKSEKEETKEKEKVKYISVMIHRADMLEANYMNAKRPMVRVHIVEARTGSYLRDATEMRENNSVAFLQPMITGKFDFRENRSMIPAWEEELIFEHSFDAITKREDDEQVVILFEVIDLLSFAEASLSYDKVGSEGCWNKIAWAFLKPVGVNNTLHTDKKVRLQLYKPKRNCKKYGRHKCEVFTWWQSNSRDKYPSSLLVTVTSVPPPKLKSVLYQQLLLNDLVDNARSDSRGLSTRTSDSIGLPKWARMAAQSCKIPNERMFETEVSENGCFYIAFSNDGKYLACVHSEEYNYPIAVYEVETGKIHVRFHGHKIFVYTLNWSNDDHHLLSASTDQTARIWDVRNQIVQHIEMLPHPSYVYCARYGPSKATIVATGCYDRVTRVWSSNRKSKKRELSQELEGHEGFVNSIVFQKSGNLITADSVGLIILWTVRRNSRIPSKREWYISRKITIDEIEGVVINTIALHPLESRLLVHSRNNGLRMVDLATGVVLQKYKQLNNQKIQLKACISPCGGLIICGGEDSVLNVWNLETGKHLARYTNDGRSSVITCVDYHPYDHVMAFSTFGSPTSVRILRYNKNVSGSDVGLILTEDTSQEQDKEVILNVLNHAPSRQDKPSSGGTTIRKGISSSRRSATDHTIIQIENNDHEQPWTTLRRLREIERNWREKSRDRLHYIIERIDSMLSRNSMFTDDVVEGERIFSVNDRRDSWIIVDNVPGNNALARDMLFEDNAANSTRFHDDLPDDDNNAQSSSTTRSKSQDHSFNLRNSATPFERTDTLESSRVNSLDSAGTYIVETPDFDENIDEVAIIAEEVDSVQMAAGSDSSRISNATFVIENERT